MPSDFFVSYTRSDLRWAEWVAWELERAGKTTVLQAWDFNPGENFVRRMSEALDQAARTIAILSEAYFKSAYSRDEWTAAFVHDRDGQGRLLPIRVELCEVPRLLAPIVYIDLAGLGEAAARDALIAGIRDGRRKPDREPAFPGSKMSIEQPPAAARRVRPRFPGSISHSVSLHLAFEYSEAFDRCISVASRPPCNLQYEDRGTGIIKARISLNWKSAGELIFFKVVDAGGMDTKVDVASRPLLPTTIFDWGKNENNLAQIVSDLRSMSPPSTDTSLRAP
jgi:hypothetical protein